MSDNSKSLLNKQEAFQAQVARSEHAPGTMCILPGDGTLSVVHERWPRRLQRFDGTPLGVPKMS